MVTLIGIEYTFLITVHWFTRCPARSEGALCRRLAISTAPLCRGARAGAAAGALPHVGPAPPEAASPWMRLYLYHTAGYGPPTLLLTKGRSLRSS